MLIEHAPVAEVTVERIHRWRNRCAFFVWQQMDSTACEMLKTNTHFISSRQEGHFLLSWKVCRRRWRGSSAHGVLEISFGKRFLAWESLITPQEGRCATTGLFCGVFVRNMFKGLTHAQKYEHNCTLACSQCRKAVKS